MLNFEDMIDIIKDAYLKVTQKKTKINKVRLLKRYLRMKYKLHISTSSLVSRLKTWKKENHD
jgi:hypothetical protein